MERALEVAPEVVVPAEHRQRRDRQHAAGLEVEPRPRVDAPVHDLVGEPQEIVRQAPVRDRALLARPEDPSLHLEPVPVRLLAHRALLLGSP